MVNKIDKKYSYTMDQKTHTVSYTVGSGENLSCFLKKFAETNHYQSSDNKITNAEWSQTYGKIKEDLKIDNINMIRAGKKIDFSEKAMEDIMTTLGMSKPESNKVKQLKSWDQIQEQYKRINSLPSNEAKVVEWHKENISENKKNYVIVDKEHCLAKVYSAEGKVLTSFEVGVGRQKGDDFLKKDRAMTTAGIYTIDYKGTGKDSYAHKYDGNIFTLKTDKGASGVALHQIPNGNGNRYTKMGNDTLEDNRYSNGCVNFTKNDFKKLEKYIGVDTKVYVLPEDKNNYLMVKNGQLNLTQKKFTGQVLTSLTNRAPQSIKLSFKNKKYENPLSTKFAMTLQTKKMELIKKLNIDNDTYNNLAVLSLGIIGQESNYGQSLKYKIKEEAPGLVGFTKKIFGNKSCNSRGLSQIKIGSYTDPETKKMLKEYKINENNLSDPEKSAIATMIVLACMYKNEVPGLSAKLSKSNMDKMDAVLYLWNGKKKEITKNTATPDKNTYIKNVKNYASANFGIKQA